MPIYHWVSVNVWVDWHPICSGWSTNRARNIHCSFLPFLAPDLSRFLSGNGSRGILVLRGRGRSRNNQGSLRSRMCARCSRTGTPDHTPRTLGLARIWGYERFIVAIIVVSSITSCLYAPAASVNLVSAAKVAKLDKLKFKTKRETFPTQTNCVPYAAPPEMPHATCLISVLVGTCRWPAFYTCTREPRVRRCVSIYNFVPTTELG